MSVLPKNRQLVLSLRNYIRDTSEIFFISSLVKISLTSFLWFSSSFTVYVFARETKISKVTIAEPEITDYRLVVFQPNAEILRKRNLFFK